MNRRELNKQQTIQDIRIAFMNLYKDQSIDKITIQQICTEAKISRALFYQYFDDKYALLENIEDTIFESGAKIFQDYMSGDQTESAADRPFPFFYRILLYAKENEVFFKPLIGPKGDPYFITRWKTWIRKDISELILKNKVNTMDPYLLSSCIAAGVIELITYWFYENPDLSADQMAGQLEIFLSNNLS